MSVNERLEELGIELPKVVAPVAAYTPALVFENTVKTSGQLPIANGRVTCMGRVGPNRTDPAEAYEAARLCALNALAAAADAAGGVDRIKRVLKVTGFVASSRAFHAQPAVINGASELYQEIFGTAHARSAIGVNALPLDASVEVEVEFEIER
ncbi:MAG: RidA family protein [Actinomycetaceae bacterium]|nr:RidA family protein [Actinomycetaceae bacterium]